MCVANPLELFSHVGWHHHYGTQNDHNMVAARRDGHLYVGHYGHQFGYDCQLDDFGCVDRIVWLAIVVLLQRSGSECVLCVLVVFGV